MADHGDVEALRSEVQRALGDDEIWLLLHAFTGPGRDGSVRVELWQHPDIGYECRLYPEGESMIICNPEPTATLALQNAHLWNLGSH